MPDIVLKNAAGEAQTHKGVDAVSASTQDGGIAVFRAEDVLTADKIKIENTNVEATNVDDAITELAEKIGQSGGSGEGSVGPVDASNVNYTPSAATSLFGNAQTNVASTLDTAGEQIVNNKSNISDLISAVFEFSDILGISIVEASSRTEFKAAENSTIAVYRLQTAVTWKPYEEYPDAEPGLAESYDVPAGCLWLYMDGDTPVSYPMIEEIVEGSWLLGLIARSALLGGTLEKGGIPAESVVLNPAISGYWNVGSALKYLLENGGASIPTEMQAAILLGAMHSVFDAPFTPAMTNFSTFLGGSGSIDAVFLYEMLEEFRNIEIADFSTFDIFKTALDKYSSGSTSAPFVFARCKEPMIFGFEDGVHPVRLFPNGSMSTSVTKSGSVLSANGLVSGETYYVENTSTSSWVAVTATASGQIDLSSTSNSSTGLTSSNCGSTVRTYSSSSGYLPANELWFNMDGFMPISGFIVLLTMMLSETGSSDTGSAYEFSIIKELLINFAKYAAYRCADTQGGGIPVESVQNGEETVAETIDDLKFQIAKLENRVSELPLTSGTVNDVASFLTVCESVPQSGDRVKMSLNNTAPNFVVKDGFPIDITATIQSDAEQKMLDSLKDAIHFGNIARYGFCAMGFTVTKEFVEGMTEEIILPTLSITFGNSTAEDSVLTRNYGSGTTTYTALSNLSVGETYQVVVNDTEYTCIAKNYISENGAGTEGATGSWTYLGNKRFISNVTEDDTGDPFVIYYKNTSVVSNGVTSTSQLVCFSYKPGIIATSTVVDFKVYQKIDNGLDVPEVGTPVIMYSIYDYDKVFALFGYSGVSSNVFEDPYAASILRVTDTSSLVPAKNISFDTTNHPELVDILPADPTMQDVLDYLLQKEVTT